MRLTKRLKFVLASVAFLFVALLIFIITYKLVIPNSVNKNHWSAISQKDVTLNFQAIFHNNYFNNAITYSASNKSDIINRSYFQYLFLHQMFTNCPHLSELHVKFHYLNNLNVDCLVQYKLGTSGSLHSTIVNFNFH